MSFIRPKTSSRYTLPYYLLGFGLILFCFAILGQIPISIALFSVDPLLSPYSFELLKNEISENFFLILLVLPFIVAFVALFITQKYIHGTNWLEQFTSRTKFDYKRMLKAAGIWFLLSCISASMSYIQTGSVEWKGFSGENGILLLISLSLVWIQSATEELFFRGYLLQALGRFIPLNWLIVLITGSLFGLVHSWNPEVEVLGPMAMVYYIWTGIFLGIIVVLDGGLELTIGYHFANNFFASYIMTNDWQAFQTPALFTDLNPPALGYAEFGQLIVYQLIFVFVVFGKDSINGLKKTLSKSGNPLLKE